MGLKTISEQFREDLLKVNLRTPPDIIVGISDYGGSVGYSIYRDELGKDGIVHNSNVLDPGNIVDISHDFREYLMKRNLQTPSEIEEAVIDLSANQSETVRNMGGIGTDATINWRSVVVDVGTIDNAAMVTRMDNFARNKPRDVTDPSESNADVIADGYNYTSLLQTIGQPGQVNDFAVPNLQSVSSKSNPVNEAAIKLDLQTNLYAPDEYTSAVLRDAILNKAYERTTYVVDYTNSLKQYTPEQYTYQNFYNVNSQASLPEIMSGSATLIKSDTMLMNIGAYMLNFNLQKRFEQNLYNATYGAVTLNEQTYETTLPATMDPLDLIRAAKDPMDNLVEKNFTITVPRNFVSKAAQFLLGLEGVASPFTLWESVDMGGKDLTPNCFLTNDGIDAMKALDPTYDAAANQGLTDNAVTAEGKKNDDELIRKTGGGQRWALYENVNMNKYSPRFDTRAELLNFSVKKPAGNYYLGSPDNPPEDLLRTREGFSLINNNVLPATFDRYGTTDYADPTGDIVWAGDSNEWSIEFPSTDSTTDEHLSLSWDKISANSPDAEAMNYGSAHPLTYSTSNDFRPCSLLDVTQKLVSAGKMDSAISNIKTRFRDGDYVYSKGNATTKVEVTVQNSRNLYSVPKTKQEIYDQGFCRTWTKVKPFRKVAHLVRYGELIRRERNSVIDRNANYNIFPTALNVGTIYDQKLLMQDGIRDRFADKNFDKVRARKYMFSIENLAWRDSEQFESLPAYQQGPSGGRIMWFPPYGLSFNETSTANWTKHDFLGRPEPIYTYNNTERTGTLSWMVIVDHPSILNLLVQKELADMSESDVDAILAAFWAGCMDYDIFELARIWGVFSNDDIRFLKDVIDGTAKYPLSMTNKKKEQTNIDITQGAQKPQTGTDKSEENTLTQKIMELKFFFPNDVPQPITPPASTPSISGNIGTSEMPIKQPAGTLSAKEISYADIYEQYKRWINGDGTQEGSSNRQYDYSTTLGINCPTAGQYFIKPVGSAVQEGINFENEYAKAKEAIKSLVDFFQVLPENKTVKITTNAFASTVAPSSEYNIHLAARRARSIVKWMVDQFKEQDTTNNWELVFSQDPESSSAADATVAQIKMNGRVVLDFIANRSNWKGKTETEMLSDVGFKLAEKDSTGAIVPGSGTALVYSEPPTYAVTGETYTNSAVDFSLASMPEYSVLSYPASYARRVTLNFSVQTSSSVPASDPNETPVELNAKTTEVNNIVNKRDIATRILSKLIGENEYFEYLSENSPVVFNSMKEKLKYFSPAFHSMTPEGLNARLTFLQQCVRPGATISTNSKDAAARYDVVNMAFGKPPICVLRIGDFFNTKMIIDTLNIEYTVVGNSVTYDLNPEGIGVQPMLAKITATVKYVGGAGLREPVAQLQNALSFNYYANADIYESMSYGQTNMDERILENLELGYNSEELDINLLKLDAYQDITYDPQTNFEYIGKIVKAYDPVTPTTNDPNQPVYNAAHIIKNELEVIHYYDMDYYEVFKKMYNDYALYIKNGAFNWLDIPFVQTPKSQYDFFLMLFSSVKSLPDNKEIVFFGENKQIDKILYRQLQNADETVSDNYYSRYFDVALDSYRKGNNFASPVLHLYPQVEDRIVLPTDFNFKNFAGAVLPRYLDMDWTTITANTYVERYKALLVCEQWFGFKNEDMLRDLLFTLPPQSRLAFRYALTDELTNYVNQFLVNWRVPIAEATNLFETSYSSIMQVLPILDGMDGGSSPKGINYLEVAPKLNVSSTPDFTRFFDFFVTDALNIYPYPLTDMAETEFFNVDTYDDDIQRGNFNFLRNQVDEDSKFKTEGCLWYDFITGEWKKGTTPQSISVSSMFEKINYEFMYFSNLMLNVLNNDKVSNVVRDFILTEHIVDLSTLFSGVNADRKNAMIMDIQHAMGIATDNYNYTYNSLTYAPLNATNVNTTLEEIQNNLKDYPYEDVLFLGFVNNAINTDAFAKAVRAKMLNAGNFNQKEKTAINTFVDKFAVAVARQTMNLEEKMTPFFNEFKSLYLQTKSNIEPTLNRISKGASDSEGYKIKMFEVDFTRANAHGKTAINNYYKFKKANT